jgi:RND superfamily putative drug exporter
MGFGLAFGVLVDAFLVRLLLVPAALRLLGRSAWWLPRWLDRLLPDLDVEGAKLQKATSKESFTLVA